MRKGTVYLVGAGPGDPDLLTLRAARLLAEADLVLHDDLVPGPVLEMCGPGAERISVGKRCGRARTTQTEIHTAMIDAARSGRSVVRLKSGDPLVFGRAAEELAALRAAGIPVEIVPGISAVFAAGAQLQMPLTDRRSASKLILIAGHHAAEKIDKSGAGGFDATSGFGATSGLNATSGQEEPEPIWRGPLPPDSTLAIYMPGRSAAALARQLRSTGLPADTPCVAISHAATPEQQVRATTLNALHTLTMPAAPVLMLVGYALQALLDTAAGFRSEDLPSLIE